MRPVESPTASVSSSCENASAVISFVRCIFNARDAFPPRSLPTPHTYTVRLSTHATYAPDALHVNMHGALIFAKCSTIFPFIKDTRYTRPPPSSRALALTNTQSFPHSPPGYTTSTISNGNSYFLCIFPVSTSHTVSVPSLEPHTTMDRAYGLAVTRRASRVASSLTTRPRATS